MYGSTAAMAHFHTLWECRSAFPLPHIVEEWKHSHIFTIPHCSMEVPQCVELPHSHTSSGRVRGSASHFHPTNVKVCLSASKYPHCAEGWNHYYTVCNSHTTVWKCVSVEVLPIFHTVLKCGRASTFPQLQTTCGSVEDTGRTCTLY